MTKDLSSLRGRRLRFVSWQKCDQENITQVFIGEVYAKCHGEPKRGGK